MGIWRGKRRLADEPTARPTFPDAVAEEIEAFLGGTYVDYLQSRERTIPSWAWLNLAAHGTADQLVQAAERRHPAPFRQVESEAATAVLRVGQMDDELVRQLQRTVLVPLELQLAHEWWCQRSPRALATVVLSQLTMQPPAES